MASKVEEEMAVERLPRYNDLFGLIMLRVGFFSNRRHELTNRHPGHKPENL